MIQLYRTLECFNQRRVEEQMQMAGLYLSEKQKLPDGKGLKTNS